MSVQDSPSNGLRPSGAGAWSISNDLGATAGKVQRRDTDGDLRLLQIPEEVIAFIRRHHPMVLTGAIAVLAAMSGGSIIVSRRRW